MAVMPMQDAEVPELILDAWNRRDLEGMLALADPEVEYVNAPDALEPGTRHGHDGLTLVVNAQWEAMPGMRQEIDRIHARDEEFFVEARISRQMPGSEHAGREPDPALDQGSRGKGRPLRGAWRRLGVRRGPQRRRVERLVI